MVVLTNTIAAAVMVALMALELSATSLQQAVSYDLPNQSIRGKSARYPQKNVKSSSAKFVKTQRGSSGILQSEDATQRDLEARHHDHDHDHHNIWVDHDHMHIHRRDRHPHSPRHHHHHHHHHDKRHSHPYHVYSDNGQPIVKLYVAASLGALDTRGLLDPVVDIAGPLMLPLLCKLLPVLKGLPVVGGLVGVLAGTLGSIGGVKIGALLAGEQMPVSAFVTDASYDPASPIQNFAYQIDISPRASGDSMFLAKLPFSLPSSPCTNVTSIPVAVAYAKVTNSTVQVLCLTYDSSPSAPSAITAQPCVNNTASMFTMSQVFAYDEVSNALQPLSNVTSTTPLGYTPASSIGSCAGSTVSTVTAGNTNGTAVKLIFDQMTPYTFSTQSNGTASNSTLLNSTLTDSTYRNSTSASNSTSTIVEDDTMADGASDDTE